MGGHWVFSAKFLLGGAKEAQEHSSAPLRAETFLETAASTLQQLKFLGSLPFYYLSNTLLHNETHARDNARHQGGGYKLGRKTVECGNRMFSGK